MQGTVSGFILILYGVLVGWIFFTSPPFTSAIGSWITSLSVEIVGTFVGGALAIQHYRSQVKEAEQRARADAINSMQYSLFLAWHLVMEHKKIELDPFRSNPARWYAMPGRYMADHWVPRFDSAQVLFLKTSDGRRISGYIHNLQHYLLHISELTKMRGEVRNFKIQELIQERGGAQHLTDSFFCEPHVLPHVELLKELTETIYKQTDDACDEICRVIYEMRDAAATVGLRNQIDAVTAPLKEYWRERRKVAENRPI